ncbi:hypothetical protein [Erythrobacter colymbi]|uniref:hypothetical protein n=1 Tax=Erythrobacter colymbi TaxID=1161202 RepID=UPI0012DFE149|nr:hypothetical protein [Erythrobacter colymbi]
MGSAFTAGSRIIDAAWRVARMHRIYPGIKAVWAFDFDGLEMKVTVEVAKPANQKIAE